MGKVTSPVKSELVEVVNRSFISPKCWGKWREAAQRTNDIVLRVERIFELMHMIPNQPIP